VDKTLIAEAETLAKLFETRPWVGLETETLRLTPHPCRWLTVAELRNAVANANRLTHNWVTLKDLLTEVSTLGSFLSIQTHRCNLQNIFSLLFFPVAGHVV
jgi:hypothetical protein